MATPMDNMNQEELDRGLGTEESDEMATPMDNMNQEEIERGVVVTEENDEMATPMDNMNQEEIDRDVVTEESDEPDSDGGVAIVPMRSVPRRSDSLGLESQDKALTAANKSLVRDLGNFELHATMQKADALFTHIMDPRSEETRRQVEALFFEPMQAITRKAVRAIESIDLTDPDAVSRQIQVVGEIFEASQSVRDVCLDHVYENMDRQIRHFSSSVDAYNAKMKETFAEALELYEQRIDTEISVRTKIMKQKREECAVMLEMAMAEADVEAAASRTRAAAQTELDEKKLALQRQKDARAHEKELKALERAETKAQQELERQRKKDEQDARREEAKMERLRRDEEAKIKQAKQKDENQHAKAIGELEAKAKKNAIDRAERDGLERELASETARYNKEFELAAVAMKNAVAKGSRCHITHTAPKIDWSGIPRVVPGSVSWTSGGR